MPRCVPAVAGRGAGLPTLSTARGSPLTRRGRALLHGAGGGDVAALSDGIGDVSLLPSAVALAVVSRFVLAAVRRWSDALARRTFGFSTPFLVLLRGAWRVDHYLRRKRSGQVAFDILH